MKRLVLVSFALALAAPSPSAAPAGGAITGKVVVVKNGVAQKADSWVYLEDVTKHRRHRTALPGEGVTAEIRQSNTQFTPHVVVVPVGATVAFPNYDIVDHNVFSPTDPPGQWDLGRYSTDHKGKSHTFEVAEEIDVYCDIHKEMWAKVKVVDSPYVAPVIGGQFTFPDVAPGSYKVVVWTPNSTEAKSEIVRISAGDKPQIIGELHVEAGEIAAHHRKDGTSYGIYKP